MGVSDRQLERLNLVAGEEIIDSWVAGVLYGTTSNATKVGGSLVLTNRRLVFVPVKLPVGMSSWGDQEWIDGYGFAIAHEDVSVSADPNRRAAILVTGAGRSMAIGIAASRFTPVFSRKNVAVRDEALAVVSAALGGGTSPSSGG